MIYKYSRFFYATDLPPLREIIREMRLFLFGREGTYKSMVITKFAVLPRQDKLLYIEALALLGVARLSVLIMPFRNIAPFLGIHMAESTYEINEDERTCALKVAKVVNTVSNHTFWESKCLVCAMTAKIMLKRRGIKSTLYMGAGFEENGQMIAHAWLRCGDLFLIGGDGSQSYAVTGKFGDI